MKKTILILIISFSCNAEFVDKIEAPIKNQQGVIISQNAAKKLLTLKFNAIEKQRYKELKAILFGAIKLAQNLNTEDADRLINSEYLKSVRKELIALRKKKSAH